MTKLLTFLMTIMIATGAYADGAKMTKSRMVDNWTVNQYHSADGSFSHCLATIDFVPANKENERRMKTRRMNMAIKVFSNESMAFIMNGVDWKFTDENRTYKIGFLFDNGRSFDLNAQASPPYGVYQEFTLDDSDWYQNMMAATDVEFSIDGQSLGWFSLAGSRKALSELLACWGTNVMENSGDTFGSGQ